MSTELVLENICKSFDSPNDKNCRIDAVDNISFTGKSGEFISLVGPSGCGKSTILKMIAGLLNPTSGVVKVDGQVIKSPSKERGMVFQEYSLFPFLTVYQNIEFAFKMNRTAKENRSIINEYISKIGLSKFSGAYPTTLSGGMRQRVALARTLICKPKILLLDEPLSALDAFTRMSMQDEILSLWRESGNLAVMVTHDVEEAVYMSTKIVLLEPHPGRIKRIINVDLGDNRKRDSERFVEYRNSILHELFSGV